MHLRHAVHQEFWSALIHPVRVLFTTLQTKALYSRHPYRFERARFAVFIEAWNACYCHGVEVSIVIIPRAYTRRHMRPNTRAVRIRHRCRTVNHREITGVYDGNYYISRDEMYATLFLDITAVVPSKPLDARRISRHDAIGRSSVFAFCYCDRLSLLKSNRFLLRVYVLSMSIKFYRIILLSGGEGGRKIEHYHTFDRKKVQLLKVDFF